MSSIVVYHSSTGNTKAVAGYIATKLGCAAVPVKSVTPESLAEYDTVIFGGRVWYGTLHKDLDMLIMQSMDRLKDRNVALFVCCLYDGENGQKQCDGLAAKYGIEKHAFFNKGKSHAKEGGSVIDGFVESVRSC